ncbi:hypothetical protein D1AOALGA4SA_8454 [Olavius algarvensis Delta 1 endosymbiont]|nr:hypothetical protein D1AOALGA4SA_8454 [Olavius algarvensis Delta 1 endosymbiont]
MSSGPDEIQFCTAFNAKPRSSRRLLHWLVVCRAPPGC